MSATITDVARKAKVSVATVSRALRGLPNVAPSTRERVLAAAQELQYVADPHASRLAGGRSETIGLVVPDLGRWFYARLFSGVETVLHEAGYDILPFTTSGPGGVGRFLEELPFRKRVDGLIVADVPLDDRQIQRIIEAGACLLTLGTSGPQASSLTIDNVGAARSAVTHLLGLGHRRIALIAGATDGNTTSSGQRRRGYEQTLRAARIPVDEALIVPADFSLEGGAEAMERLMRLDVRPTAVFACSDEMAIGAMQVLRDGGIPVPDAMSVVGFDGHEVAEYLGLTTIRQDVLGQGERAGELLVEQLEVEHPPIRHEEYPTRLIVRRTTARPHATADAG